MTNDNQANQIFKIKQQIIIFLSVFTNDFKLA